MIKLVENTSNLILNDISNKNEKVSLSTKKIKEGDASEIMHKFKS